MLCVIDPLSLVPDALGSIVESTLASGLIILPLSHIYVSVSLRHLAPAVEQTVLEGPLISSTVWVQLHTQAILAIGFQRPKGN